MVLAREEDSKLLLASSTLILSVPAVEPVSPLVRGAIRVVAPDMIGEVGKGGLANLSS